MRACVKMSTERRLSRSFHSCLKGSSTEEAADEEESCYHSLGGRHSLTRQPQVYVEDLSSMSLADFEDSTVQDENNGSYICYNNSIFKQFFLKAFIQLAMFIFYSGHIMVVRDKLLWLIYTSSK